MKDNIKTVECSTKFSCKSAEWTWNTKSEIVTYSDNWKGMLGFDVHEIGTSISEWIDRLHPQDRFKTVKYLTSLKKDLNNNFDFFYRIKNFHQL